MSEIYSGDTFYTTDDVNQNSENQSVITGETYISDEENLQGNATILPDEERGIVTQMPNNDTTHNNEVDIREGTNIDGYIIMSILSSQGNEAIVYRATKAGNDYVIKIYKRKINISDAKIELIKSIDCPYIVKLIDYGKYNELFYEVYKYYENGTLAEHTKIDTKTLKKYINQLNEGLHNLHCLNESNCIVHGDIKPSNIFLSDDENTVLIGDFGISAILEGTEEGFGNICGTPEFAPPSIGIVNKTRKSPSYDYGSLGLLIYYMATGYSYFSNYTTEEIAQGWINGIVIPDTVDTSIKKLLNGLLVVDENSRYTYKEIKEWCDGAFVQAIRPKKLFIENKEKSNITLWFGLIDNQNIEVSSINELVNQMKLHWNQAKNKLRDQHFYDFINSFDESGAMSLEIKKHLEENDIDSAVFKAIYTLSSDSDIVYNGVNYGNAEKFIETISVSSEKEVNMNARAILLNGLFKFYLEKMGYSQEIALTVEEIINMRSCSDEIKVKILKYIFTKDKTYNGWNNENDLRSAVSNMNLQQIDELISDENFISWIYAIGLKDLALSMISVDGENNE